MQITPLIPYIPSVSGTDRRTGNVQRPAPKAESLTAPAHTTVAADTFYSSDTSTYVVRPTNYSSLDSATWQQKKAVKSYQRVVQMPATNSAVITGLDVRV